MKSDKGITLVSLIIYVIVMLAVVAIIGTVTSYFYKNINSQYAESTKTDDDTNLNMYLLNDLKNKKVTLLNSSSGKITESITGLTILRIQYEDSSVIQYTISSDGIYRDKLKIYNKEANGLTFGVIELVDDEKMELQILSGTTVLKSYVVNVNL